VLPRRRTLHQAGCQPSPAQIRCQQHPAMVCCLLPLMSRACWTERGLPQAAASCHSIVKCQHQHFHLRRPNLTPAMQNPPLPRQVTVESRSRDYSRSPLQRGGTVKVPMMSLLGNNRTRYAVMMLTQNAVSKPQDTVMLSCDSSATASTVVRDLQRDLNMNRTSRKPLLW